MILKEAHITRQEITSITSDNLDGSSTSLDGDGFTDFSYDQFGQLTNQYSLMETASNDGSDNTSASRVETFSWSTTERRRSTTP